MPSNQLSINLKGLKNNNNNKKYHRPEVIVQALQKLGKTLQYEDLHVTLKPARINLGERRRHGAKQRVSSARFTER